MALKKELVDKEKEEDEDEFYEHEQPKSSTSGEN
jgi:hypothetical protein